MKKFSCFFDKTINAILPLINYDEIKYVNILDEDFKIINSLINDIKEYFNRNGIDPSFCNLPLELLTNIYGSYSLQDNCAYRDFTDSFSKCIYGMKKKEITESYYNNLIKFNNILLIIKYLYDAIHYKSEQLC